MKLGKRVSLSIIPVILTSYLLVLVGAYQLEKTSYLRSEAQQLEAHLDRFSAMLVLYESVVDTYVSSFIGNDILKEAIKEQDSRYRVMVMENRIHQTISDLSEVEYDALSLALIEANGTIKYFYERGGDPFSEPSDQMLGLVRNLFDDRRNALSDILIEPDLTLALRVRIINPLTLKEPLGGDWSDSVAVVLQMDLKNLDRLKAELSKEYRVEFAPTNDFQLLRKNSFGISGSKQLSPLLSVYLSYDEDIIQNHLDKLLWQAGMGVLGLAFLSSFILLMLVKKYVTKPIQELEEKIIAVNTNGEEFSYPGNETDEVSALGRSFYHLYGQLKASYTKTKVLAEVDSLTKLSNRRVFMSYLERLIDRGGEEVAVIFMDLDNFKFVNDNYGHDAGDVLLREFSDRLKTTIRPTDVMMSAVADDTGMARLAGDEFAVALRGVHCERDVSRVAQRILALFDGGFECSAGRFPVSVSMGVALFPHDGENAEQLIINADSAMYQAKKNGKNQLSFYSVELAALAKRELQIEGKLKENNYSEFEMYYMPVVDSSSSKVIGVEALIRWFSVDLGFVSPTEFIPIAESRGLFKDLDVWVFKKVLADIPAIQLLFGDDCKISINISSAQLSSDDFFLHLMYAIKDSEVPRNLIELEITETFSATMSGRVEANLSLIKQAGFKLALDDFGTGHTSLKQLLDYPLDVIKIDKSLVDRTFDGGGELLSALIGFCKTQGYTVTAEGVETPEQAEFLRASGADNLQGYYFGKPVALAALQKQKNFERYASNDTV